MFAGQLVSEKPDFLPEFSNLSSEETILYDQTEKTSADDDVSHNPPISRKSVLFIIVSIVCLLLFLAWLWFPQNDENQIRQVIEDSQKFESLVLYRNPQIVTDSHFKNYWLPETGFKTELDITRIRAGIRRLVNEGKYYGHESKCEQFEFQSVEINEAKDFAVVRTLEKWFIAEYFTDGTLHKNKTVGPYFVTYTLQKADGQWLIEKSNTARAKPTPIH